MVSKPRSRTIPALCRWGRCRGTVLIAGGTWDLLTDKPAGERLEPLKVKGREAPVEVYSVGDRVASPA